MEDNSYLIALALIEQEGKRSIPLGGKSIKKSFDPKNNQETGEELLKELLIRVFQKSESGSIKRVNSDNSLLLIQIPMLPMQEKIPLIKAQWIESGNNQQLISQLIDICQGIWSANFTREEGLNFTCLE
ncbi:MULTISPECIES: hypothetical protein [Prochlorococcus]|uniref:Uncharacterized protein n=1 Tax=Prochlorococcus marinus (strain SARG / CCMP1375 / SS120) TaxID=167539 RepID=Q7VDK1_PROMA|nr:MULTISPECIES: hypothetical protein [Prochlorococcus]AAP99421.1 Predicted protein [Prochlorococcus marinus subsp. marinus str. CCMP1375]KGG11311.1 hypothetical protein EV04_1389 [Prochlorococcus marinus str. LG]KGG18734.1 hypothetical protein EV08_1983 [Prochlorococcus marinus str. SS2]KGG23008.1 hypothetical protein EV09_1751 [Prochlorococcus marinus str. SS35]KGG33714.1 hypothetical protein EV10_0149 [Prochlorococcus marinus str. SS51]